MKNLIVALLCMFVMSCNYQEAPPPPASMEKVVLVDILDSDCCHHTTKVRRLKDSTMAGIQIGKVFQIGDTMLVRTKDLFIDK